MACDDFVYKHTWTGFDYTSVVLELINYHQYDDHYWSLINLINPILYLNNIALFPVS